MHEKIIFATALIAGTLLIIKYKKTGTFSFSSPISYHQEVGETEYVNIPDQSVKPKVSFGGKVEPPFGTKKNYMDKYRFEALHDLMG